MSDIVVKQMPAFRKAYKKLHPNVKAEVNEAIKVIIKNPKAGEEKKGNLAGVFAYKFKVAKHMYLLAYEWRPKSRLLLMLSA